MEWKGKYLAIEAFDRSALLDRKPIRRSFKTGELDPERTQIAGNISRSSAPCPGLSDVVSPVFVSGNSSNGM